MLEQVRVSQAGALWWPYLEYYLFYLYQTWMDVVFCDSNVNSKGLDESESQVPDAGEGIGFWREC